METSLFPLIKKFHDLSKNYYTAYLTEDIIIHDKSFRRGSVFSVLGWREVANTPYLVISKGSWEGLVDYDSFLLVSEKICI